MIRTKDIPPPSSLNLAVPEELDDIVMKALARNPDDRFPSVQEFREALLPVPRRSRPHRRARPVDGRTLLPGTRDAPRASSTRLEEGARANRTPTRSPRSPTRRKPTGRLGQGSRANSQALEGVQKGTILVVDDTEDIRDILTRDPQGRAATT
jgi:serine/threonine-protein kinase